MTLLPSERPDPQHSQRTTSYLLNTESILEMVRLSKLDAILTKGMGGLFPEQAEQDLAHITRIVDLACGPGGWALHVAERYPDKHVIGVDISEQMIDYANAQARSHGLSNVTFERANVLHPLPFADATFDLVNARFLFSFLPRDYWLTFFHECWRILAFGGILRCTEPERNVSTSAAHMKLEALAAHLLHQVGHTPSPDPNFYGVVACLPSWFQQVGFVSVQHQAHLIDFSAGTEAHTHVSENYKNAWLEATPVLIKYGLITAEELEQLIHQAQIDMLDAQFRAAGFYATVWGEKVKNHMP